MKKRTKGATRSKLSHLAADGRARMVDVGGKAATVRLARAQAEVRLGPRIAAALRKTGAIAKGNVVETARLAGILAAKRTAELIPMCHPLALDSVEISTAWKGNVLCIEAVVRCTGRTGVEMEALSAAAIAALTVYDMCKSAGKGIVIADLRLLEKSGGKSGHWQAAARRRAGERHGNA
jgi:cyclic pyranopterin monophosphate synthase